MKRLLTDQVSKNLLALIAGAAIPGRDAGKVVSLTQIIKESKTRPYYEIPDDLAKWAGETINNVTIEGRSAAALLEVYIALMKPIDNVPNPLPPPDEMMGPSTAPNPPAQ